MIAYLDHTFVELANTSTQNQVVGNNKHLIGVTYQNTTLLDGIKRVHFLSSLVHPMGLSFEGKNKHQIGATLSKHHPLRW
jgi:hypothetical protein